MPGPMGRPGGKMEMRLLRDLSEESTKKAGCVCVTARVDSREFTSGMR